MLFARANRKYKTKSKAFEGGVDKEFENIVPCPTLLTSSIANKPTRKSKKVSFEQDRANYQSQQSRMRNFRNIYPANLENEAPNVLFTQANNTLFGQNELRRSESLNSGLNIKLINDKLRMIDSRLNAIGHALENDLKSDEFNFGKKKSYDLKSPPKEKEFRKKIKANQVIFNLSGKKLKVPNEVLTLDIVLVSRLGELIYNEKQKCSSTSTSSDSSSSSDQSQDPLDLEIKLNRPIEGFRLLIEFLSYMVRGVRIRGKHYLSSVADWKLLISELEFWGFDDVCYRNLGLKEAYDINSMSEDLDNSDSEVLKYKVSKNSNLSEQILDTQFEKSKNSNKNAGLGISKFNQKARNEKDLLNEEVSENRYILKGKSYVSRDNFSCNETPSMQPWQQCSYSNSMADKHISKQDRSSLLWTNQRWIRINPSHIQNDDLWSRNKLTWYAMGRSDEASQLMKLKNISEKKLSSHCLCSGVLKPCRFRNLPKTILPYLTTSNYRSGSTGWESCVAFGNDDLGIIFEERLSLLLKLPGCNLIGAYDSVSEIPEADVKGGFPFVINYLNREILEIMEDHGDSDFESLIMEIKQFQDYVQNYDLFISPKFYFHCSLSLENEFLAIKGVSENKDEIWLFHPISRACIHGKRNKSIAYYVPLLKPYQSNIKTNHSNDTTKTGWEGNFIPTLIPIHAVSENCSSKLQFYEFGALFLNKEVRPCSPPRLSSSHFYSSDDSSPSFVEQIGIKKVVDVTEDNIAATLVLDFNSTFFSSKETSYRSEIFTDCGDSRLLKLTKHKLIAIRIAGISREKVLGKDYGITIAHHACEMRIFLLIDGKLLMKSVKFDGNKSLENVLNIKEIIFDLSCQGRNNCLLSSTILSQCGPNSSRLIGFFSSPQVLAEYNFPENQYYQHTFGADRLKSIIQEFM